MEYRTQEDMPRKPGTKSRERTTVGGRKDNKPMGLRRHGRHLPLDRMDTPTLIYMSDLQRLDFEERAQQWFITEVYSDARSKPGEPFMASGHERYTKLQQVLDRVRDKYPDYRPIHIPYDRVNDLRYSLDIVSLQAESD